ncbi:hypothetical protein J2X31_000925 [Flavobacterium arsenatis]|uniref:DUF2971 domain-containing protein n=1 Tax=Flavobacterium arsenatis TaxID=1484332 RepID=A0ABU1TLT6_9FLAO|nr:DUF2971 domain-containing protein [Flavobacterium arsenatis]MDR6966925.1 hypothetical protein [Flavobacterium arsenatis]
MNIYYKYLPPERLSYLDDELLRYTQPIDLNDPFECLPKKPSEKEFKDVIKKVSELLHKKGFPLNENAEILELEKIYNEAYQNVNNDIGILSLTKNWNNTLMWSHYTNSHKGFCIGFDPKDEYFQNFLSSDLKKSKLIMEVVYSDKRVEIPLEFGKKKLEFEPFITKSTDWKYEEEVRVISTLNMSDKKINSNPVDIHLFKVPHKSIKEIVAGANMDKENEDLIKDFCTKNKIEFYKSKISDEQFNMERK